MKGVGHSYLSLLMMRQVNHVLPSPLRACGCEGKRIAFLFTDNHIVSEAFVEDINSLLNSGEITGLFPPDDR